MSGRQPIRASRRSSRAARFAPTARMRACRSASPWSKLLNRETILTWWPASSSAEINARAIVIPQGFTAERLVSGEAELAVQQISELKQVAGIDVIGPIPHELQTPAVFSAGRVAASAKAAQADRLLKILASPEVAPVLREWGLEP